MGTPATEKLRAIKSFREWCLIVLPGAILQTKLWRPWASTVEPQRHSYGKQKSHLSLRPTTTLTASSSNCRPHEAIGRVNSQSPLCCVQAAKKEARLWGDFNDDSTTALYTNMPGRSRNGCLGGRISGMSPNWADQEASLKEIVVKRKHNQTRWTSRYS